MLSLIYNTSSAYKALGKFNVMTWIGLMRLLLLFPALLWATASAKSIVAVGWSHALVAFVGSVISLLVTSRILGLPLRELFASLWPPLFASGIMALAVLLTLNLVSSLSPIEQLIIVVPIGGLAYFTVLWIVRRDLVLGVYKKLHAAFLSGKKKFA